MKIESVIILPKIWSIKNRSIFERCKIGREMKALLDCFSRSIENCLLISFFRWKEIVLNLADKIANRLTVDVQKRDSMNILDYVHIKKLHVDVEEPKSEVYCYFYWLNIFFNFKIYLILSDDLGSGVLEELAT